MRTFDVNAEIMLECEGEYVREERERFDKSFGNWLPLEQSELKKFRVYMTRTSKNLDGQTFKKRIEITDYLTQEEFIDIYNECMEQVEGNE